MQANDTVQPDAHEHILQMLSAIMLQINATQIVVRDDHPLDVEAIRTGLSAMEQITREVIRELRAASDDPPLPELVGVTLVEALTRAVEETAEALGLSSRVSFSGEERALPAYSERLLYRIAQEAFYQVQQHTHARKLRFTFNFGRDEVVMSIEDDGTLPTLPPSSEETPFPHVMNDEAASLQEADLAMPRPYFQAESQSVYERDPFSALRHRIEHLGGSLDVGVQLTTPATPPVTRVQVHLPYIIPTANIQTAMSSAPGTQLLPTVAEKIRILVVDNLAVSRAGLRRLLESYADLQVVGEAADGVQAVSETLELGPQVVLMDALLPNGQSMEALKQIKQLNLNARVLLLAAQYREEFLYETLQAGADGYVLKDIAPDELSEAVRVVARGEMLVQPQLASRLLTRFGRQGRGTFPYETLTAREQDVLQLLARGLRNKEIAARLYVSERTVNFHLANIYQKLNVSGRTEALSKALEQGLVTV
ncbi:MAG TPA: LuxR C-terminal-related transcriptional regulator [Ktedonobacteraceae bacterium]|nr:LuxR C-terminal-related transcriptional regulator [Ktedonobacteraceae bacterium]